MNPNNEKAPQAKKTDAKLRTPNDTGIILLSSDSEVEDQKSSNDNRKQCQRKYSYNNSNQVPLTLKLENPPLDSQPIKTEPENPVKLEDNYSHDQPDSSYSQNTNDTKLLVATKSENQSSPEKKPIRPFQIYPSFPYDLIHGFDSAKLDIREGTPEGYHEFRMRMMGARYYRTPGINKNMNRFQNCGTTDIFYAEKRQRNNLAAKRSRDARKIKEDEIAVRCAFLEQENIFLKAQIAAAEQEAKKMKGMLDKARASITNCICSYSTVN